MSKGSRTQEKYYVVINGRQPGIYITWENCRKQVDKFSGALYKSFTSRDEAEEYITNFGTDMVDKCLPTQAVCHSTKKFKSFYTNRKANVKEYIDVYTDGSHSKHTKEGYLGGGGRCEYNKRIYKFSFECDDDLLESYDIEPSTKVSNPTVEFFAFAEFLSYFYQQPLRSGICLRFYIDYIGVQHWMNGDWRTKEEYIRKIKEACVGYLKDIDCEVEIHHVEGHGTSVGNNEADTLAKDTKVHSDIHKLVKQLCFEEAIHRGDGF